eukprot:CFRG3878T1
MVHSLVRLCRTIRRSTDLATVAATCKQTKCGRSFSVAVPTSECHTNASANAAAIYVHWPYCKKLCSYCNFNRYVRDEVDHERMRNCLVTELKTSLELCTPRKISSVFFGGGTPTLAEPETIAAILNVLSERGLTEQGVTEITMEGNPTSIESTRMSEFKDAGVNRMSLGVQSLTSPDDLLFLGRNHSINDALSAVEIARKLFPSRFSIDLIFGRPGQTRALWQKELDTAIDLVDDHVSLYQLTIEPGTKLHRLYEKGAFTMPCEDTMADMYEDAVSTLKNKGLERYEVSNFSTPGSECKHNQNYWRGGDYIGLGPGAHSRLTISDSGVREERIQIPSPEQWMKQVTERGHGTRRVVPQTIEVQRHEMIMMGMRTREGIFDSSKWRSVTNNKSPFEWFETNEKVARLVDADLVVCDSKTGSVQLTARGIALANLILPDLL